MSVLFLGVACCVLGVLGVFVAVAVVLLFRNEAVYRVRMRFIDKPDFPRSYLRLPEYGEMLYSPKFWPLWTASHWQSWLNKQEQP